MKLKVFASLKRKYGPLPLWAWALIAGGAIALWWRMRKPAEAPADAIAEPSFAAAGEPDYGDTGTYANAGAPGVEATEGGELYADNKLREASMEYIDSLRALTEEAQAAAGVPQSAGEEGGGADATEPDTGDASSVRGVKWGGRTFTTKAGLAKWLAAHGAGQGNAGRAFRTWAKRHPGAAATLAGKAPKPKPPRRPKAPAQHSKRQAGRAAPKPGRGTAGARKRQPAQHAAAPAQTRPRAAPRPKPKPAPHPKRKPPRSRARR